MEERAGHRYHRGLSVSSDGCRAGRDIQAPLTQLTALYVKMCWCTPPSVWHALLLLLRSAAHLHCVLRLLSNDPLVIAALGYLPCITALGTESLWPLSFATFTEAQSERSAVYRYSYLSHSAVSGHA